MPSSAMIDIQITANRGNFMEPQKQNKNLEALETSTIKATKASTQEIKIDSMGTKKDSGKGTKKAPARTSEVVNHISLSAYRTPIKTSEVKMVPHRTNTISTPTVEDINTLQENKESTDEELANACRKAGLSENEADSRTLSGSEAEETLKPERPKALSGAARKRLKYYLSQGLERKEALEKARLPLNKDKYKPIQKDSVMGGAPKTPKRKRTNTSTPTNTEKMDAKKPKTVASNKEPTPGSSKEHQTDAQRKEHRQTKSYAQIASNIKVGILSTDYPETLLTSEQMEAVQGAILEKMVQGEGKEIGPKFSGLSMKPGWISLNCANRETADWIKTIVPSLNLEGLTGIMAVEGEQLPKPHIITVFLPNSRNDSVERIFSLLKTQNPGLQTDRWKTLNKADGEKGCIITVSIDDESMTNIKGKSMQLAYKFGTITVRIKAKAMANRKKQGPNKEMDPKEKMPTKEDNQGGAGEAMTQEGSETENK